jgi:hypothetical protein
VIGPPVLIPLFTTPNDACTEEHSQQKRSRPPG